MAIVVGARCWLRFFSSLSLLILLHIYGYSFQLFSPPFRHLKSISGARRRRNREDISRRNNNRTANKPRCASSIDCIPSAWNRFPLVPTSSPTFDFNRLIFLLKSKIQFKRKGNYHFQSSSDGDSRSTHAAWNQEIRPFFIEESEEKK